MQHADVRVALGAARAERQAELRPCEVPAEPRRVARADGEDLDARIALWAPRPSLVGVEERDHAVDLADQKLHVLPVRVGGDDHGAVLCQHVVELGEGLAELLGGLEDGHGARARGRRGRQRLGGGLTPGAPDEQRHRLAALPAPGRLRGRVGEPARQDPAQVREDRRLPRDHRAEVLVPKLERQHRHRRDDGGRPRLPGDERHLADDVAAAEVRDDALPAGGVCERHVGEAVGEYEHLLAGLSGAAEGFLGREPARLQHGKDPLERAGVEPFEQRVLAERRDRHRSTRPLCRLRCHA